MKYPSNSTIDCKVEVDGCFFMDRKVTALSVQKKNPNRINVFLDGDYAFGISRIAAGWLTVGQSLTEDRVSALKRQDAIEVGLQKALEQLNYRPRSESEIQKKLQKVGFESDVITAVVDRLRESGLVQDQKFARIWIENRSTFRPRSHRYLAYELRQKGLKDEVIEDALTEAVGDNQLAYQAAARYATRLDGVDWSEFRRRLSAFLGRRGFSFGTINPIVRQIWLERSHDVDSNTILDNKDVSDG